MSSIGVILMISVLDCISKTTPQSLTSNGLDRKHDHSKRKPAAAPVATAGSRFSSLLPDPSRSVDVPRGNVSSFPPPMMARISSDWTITSSVSKVDKPDMS